MYLVKCLARYSGQVAENAIICLFDGSDEKIQLKREDQLFIQIHICTLQCTCFTVEFLLFEHDCFLTIRQTSQAESLFSLTSSAETSNPGKIKIEVQKQLWAQSSRWCFNSAHFHCLYKPMKIQHAMKLARVACFFKLAQ